MNHQLNGINFKNNIFECPDLTRINGESTTANLKTLQNDAKANVQAVNSKLGGGEHGHVALVCLRTMYAMLVPDNTPYIKQPNPKQLIIEGMGTQYQIGQRR